MSNLVPNKLFVINIIVLVLTKSRKCFVCNVMYLVVSITYIIMFKSFIVQVFFLSCNGFFPSLDADKIFSSTTGLIETEFGLVPFKHKFYCIAPGAVMVLIIWQLDLQLHMQSVPITINAVSSNPTHVEVYSIQHYVIKFVRDLQQVCGFLSTLFSSNNTDSHNITEILLNVVINTMSPTLTLTQYSSPNFIQRSNQDGHQY